MKTLLTSILFLGLSANAYALSATSDRTERDTPKINVSKTVTGECQCDKLPERIHAIDLRLKS